MFDTWMNISEIDMFALPKPQIPLKNWTVDKTFKIVSGKLSFSLTSSSKFESIILKTNYFKIDLNIHLIINSLIV